MLMMRLQRVGRKHDPSYRIVVTEKSRGPKSANYVEVLGNYDPRKDKKDAVVIKSDRAEYWLSVGAQPSDTVHNILVGAGIKEGKKVAKHASKNWGEPEKKEEPVTDEVRAEAGESQNAPEESSEEEAKPADTEGSDEAKEETKEEK